MPPRRRQAPKSHNMVHRFAGLRLGPPLEPASDLATSREHSIKRSTIGLKVRSLSVTIATGQWEGGKLTGKIFKWSVSEWSDTTEFGSAAMKEPRARKYMTRGNEKVIKADFRHSELAFPKCFGDEPISPGFFRRKQPGLVAQIGQVDFATTGPNAVFGRHHD
jgi:hypothetical protein